MAKLVIFCAYDKLTFGEGLVNAKKLKKVSTLIFYAHEIDPPEQRIP
jgi:hypothetical protein